MNSTAHQMKINEMIASLGCLDVSEVSRSAIEKAFEYVCGVKMRSNVTRYYHHNGYMLHANAR
jgi:hypothetical protein